MNVEDLKNKIIQGDRASLARGITLIESSNDRDQERALELLEMIPEHSQSWRLAITGAPGVGKSTFINQFGQYVASQGKKLAVLAIDPSSEKTGGSILGDKTRMGELSQLENVFIRPSPSLNYLGGVGERTFESILLCEAAGFDIVLVETVGVGQSEYRVSSMVDQVLLLIQPGLGDGLQGIKRGILEICDGLVVNKADGEGKKLALETQRQYQLALELLHGTEKSPWVKSLSSLSQEGFEEIFKKVDVYFHQKHDQILKRRCEQLKKFFYAWIKHNWEMKFRKEYLSKFEELETQIDSGQLGFSRLLSMGKSWLE